MKHIVTSYILLLHLGRCHVVLAASWIENTMLTWFKNSDFVAKRHAEHVAADKVQHMLKNTPLVAAPDEAKLSFATGFAGRLVARVMKSEQEILGEWKVSKIIEAAGANFDEESTMRRLAEEVNKVPVVVFSFEDCPWCLLAKRLLGDAPYNLENGDGVLRVIELEDLGWEGKYLRAAIAIATGRTSMPACFIGGRSIGGFTDGFSSSFKNNLSYNFCMMNATGLEAMHESGILYELIVEAKQKHATFD